MERENIVLGMAALLVGVALLVTMNVAAHSGAYTDPLGSMHMDTGYDEFQDEMLAFYNEMMGDDIFSESMPCHGWFG